MAGRRHSAGGQINSADYKNYIFSILFLKRLSDRLDEEVESAVFTRGGAPGNCLH